jgi:hypothetical protein
LTNEIATAPKTLGFSSFRVPGTGMKGFKMCQRGEPALPYIPAPNATENRHRCSPCEQHDSRCPSGPRSQRRLAKSGRQDQKSDTSRRPKCIA